MVKNSKKIIAHIERAEALLHSLNFGANIKLLLVRNRNCIQDSMKLSIYSKIITSDGKHIFIGKVTGWTTNKRVLECQKLYEWQTEMVYAWPEGSRIYLQDKKGLCVMNSTTEFNEPNKDCEWEPYIYKEDNPRDHVTIEYLLRYLDEHVQDTIEISEINETIEGDRKYLLEKDSHVMSMKQLELFDKSKTLHKRNKYKPNVTATVDACDSNYFGEQTREGNCWIHACFGLMMKFLSSDIKLHSRYDNIKKKMYNNTQLLVTDILKTERLSRFANLWKMYGSVIQYTTPMAHKNITTKYKNYYDYEIFSINDGGQESYLFLACCLLENYTVHYIKDTLSLTLRMNTLNNELTLVQKNRTAIHDIHLGVNNKKDYFIVRYDYRDEQGIQEDNRQNKLYMGEILERELDYFREYGILHRLVGGFFAMEFKKKDGTNDDAHVVMFGICKGKLILCDSQEGKCVGVKSCALYGGYFKRSVEWKVSYVFAPENIQLSHQFTKSEILGMKRFRTMYGNDYLAENNTSMYWFDVPFDAYYKEYGDEKHVVQVIKNKSSWFNSLYVIHDQQHGEQEVHGKFLTPIPYMESLSHKIAYTSSKSVARIRDFARYHEPEAIREYQEAYRKEAAAYREECRAEREHSKRQNEREGRREKGKKRKGKRK